MTKDEILEDLNSKGIITIIGDEYLITEKYKELLLPKTIIEYVAPEKPKNFDRDKLLDPKTNGSDWPAEILETTGRTRAVAFMDLCDIPSMPKQGGYRLRGLSSEAVNILGNIIDSKEVYPTDLIQAISYYYKHSERPKAVKTILIDGDILDIYNDHISGELQKGLNPKGETNSSSWQ